MNFTNEQQLAIDLEGKNIIVSAGAGSGKTAVLTSRVIRKLKQGIDINKLLILTFTNEAANEMKNRIRKAIISNKLERQLSLLDSAYISTFDSFALSLVKKYHYLLNIGRDIKIVESNIITIYKYQILEDIFESMYGEDNFNKLITDYCLKDDKNIRNFIINIDNKLDLVTDKEKYLNNYIETYFSDEYFCTVKEEYLKLVNDKIKELDDLLQNFLPHLNNNLADKTLAWLKPLIDGNDYQTYKLFKTTIAPRYINLSEEASILKEELKNKALEIKSLLRYDSLDEMLLPIKNNQSNIEVLIKIVRLLDREVIKYKEKYGVYEFNDISHMAIKIVKDYPDICKEIKEFFNEIMVDEYQDTSNLQETFISYITNDNVYMVGDIKQSIYRFRNANPYIFETKYNKYARNDGGAKIDLVKNFRSRKETLHNINEIFNLIMDDNIGNANYLKEHNMVYGNTDYDKEDTGTNNYMEIYNYDVDIDNEKSYEKELFIISKDIQEKIKNKYQVYDKDLRKLRDLKYDDICIITDRNKYLPTYKKILEYHEIPSVIYMDEILTNDMVILAIKNLITLVWYVHENCFDEKFKYVYTSVARSFIYELSDNEIYHDITSGNFLNNELVSLAKEVDFNNPLVMVINDILVKYNVYQKLIKLTDIEKNIVLIDNLINILQSVSELGYNMANFINYLCDVDNMDLAIKYAANTTGNNAVKIMNIHKSKGLEFSLCYYTGLDNKFTIKDISTKFLINEKYGIILPYMGNEELENTILKDLYVNDYYQAEISEKLRLFYVALTRCREKMIILANVDDNKTTYNCLVPSNVRLKYRSFLDILNSLDVTHKYITDKNAMCNQEYNKITLKEITLVGEEMAIDKRAISVNATTEMRKHFFKENHQLIDSNQAKAMEYGTKVHEMLEYADFKKSGNQTISKLLGHFESNFINSYHEYEFMYEEDMQTYHGVIDLMLEYADKIYIVDYKLKQITDEAYQEQLSGYKKYISMITDKKVKTFLYSIIDNEVMEVVCEK